MQKDDKKVLKIISNETKNSIMDISVVTPSMYASIFAKFSQSHDMYIENESTLAYDLLSKECLNLTNLQKNTSKNVQKLSYNTNKAIHAIKNNDETLLNKVLKETNKLRTEIEKLKEAVYKDALTHVYNRKWLHDNLLDDKGDKLIQNGTLAMIDLNYFKEINDTHGHIIGDKVLIFISNQLQKMQKNIVRYGGDEFIIIFEDIINSDEAIKQLSTLRNDIVSKKLRTFDSSFKVSFSLGVCEFKKGDVLSDIVELADKSMYDDKIKFKKIVTGI